MTATMPELQTVPLIECAPWCVDGDGHPDCIFTDDQRCDGPEWRSPATCYPDVRLSDGGTEPDYVTVYAQRFYGRPSHVVIGRGELDTINLTPAEARQVIENLQQVLGQLGEERAVR